MTDDCPDECVKACLKEPKYTKKDAGYAVSAQEWDGGTKVEMEHTKDPDVASIITSHHLEEIPDYYTRLHIMEKRPHYGCLHITDIDRVIEAMKETWGPLGGDDLSVLHRVMESACDSVTEEQYNKYMEKIKEMERRDTEIQWATRVPTPPPRRGRQ